LAQILVWLRQIFDGVPHWWEGSQNTKNPEVFPLAYASFDSGITTHSLNQPKYPEPRALDCMMAFGIARQTAK
jgi:hypothetical protein